MFPAAADCYNLAVRVSELGEIGLVDLITRTIEANRNQEAIPWKRMVLGPGDDAAAWWGENTIQLATTDSLVENVHFKTEILDWQSLGWKALAINLSDIAAMGGIPQYALVSLGIPDWTIVEDVISFYRGMLDLANQTGVTIAGGDTDCTPQIYVSVTVLGYGRENLLLRSNAKPGELIAITGNPGNASAGLKLLMSKTQPDNDDERTLEQAFKRPVPRLLESKLLVEAGIRTAIDISDGLLTDLSRICRASKTGAFVNIENLPVSRALYNLMGERSLEIALTGGEDYELLFTGSQEAISFLRSHTECPINIIGEITSENAGRVVLMKNGREYTVSNSGWEHFVSKPGME